MFTRSKLKKIEGHVTFHGN